MYVSSLVDTIFGFVCSFVIMLPPSYLGWRWCSCWCWWWGCTWGYTWWWGCFWWWWWQIFFFDGVMIIVSLLHMLHM